MHERGPLPPKDKLGLNLSSISQINATNSKEATGNINKSASHREIEGEGAKDDQKDPDKSKY